MGGPAAVVQAGDAAKRHAAARIEGVASPAVRVSASKMLCSTLWRMGTSMPHFPL